MASVYVGTYAKYNNGDLSGEWVDLSEFSSLDEFLEKCAEIHADEEGPEFMFQDTDSDYFGMIEESSINPEIFEILNLSEDAQEMFAAYRAINSEGTIKEAEDAFSGRYDSDEDFAQDMAEQIGALDRNASWPQTCIDWEWAARELMYDYSSHNGFYFCN